MKAPRRWRLDPLATKLGQQLLTDAVLATLGVRDIAGQPPVSLSWSISVATPNPRYSRI